MKVSEVIAKLAEYNQESEFEIIAHNKEQAFSFVYGGAEGVTKLNCTTVGLYLDETCQNEQV